MNNENLPNKRFDTEIQVWNLPVNRKRLDDLATANDPAEEVSLCVGFATSDAGERYVLLTECRTSLALSETYLKPQFAIQLADSLYKQAEYLLGKENTPE